MEGKTPSVKWIEIIYCYFLNVVYIKPTGALGKILQRYCRQKKNKKLPEKSLFLLMECGD